jgi:hypothetical protein
VLVAARGAGGTTNARARAPLTSDGVLQCHCQRVEGGKRAGPKWRTRRRAPCRRPHAKQCVPNPFPATLTSAASALRWTLDKASVHNANKPVQERRVKRGVSRQGGGSVACAQRNMAVCQCFAPLSLPACSTHPPRWLRAWRGVREFVVVCEVWGVGECVT